MPISPHILALPKAELHLHLEGSVDPATLAELSRRHDAGTTRLLDESAVERLYQYRDFLGFLNAFKEVAERLRTSDDYELITYRLMQKLKAENVLHAEAYVSVGVINWYKLDFDTIFEGLERGRQNGERDFGVSLLWIFDAVRQFGAERAQRVFEQAVRCRDRRVIGVGIGGDENRGPAEMFREQYAYAASHGLRLSCHAGEAAGPESIIAALDVLKAERIGHGLKAWRDEALLARLAAEQIPIEVSVSSNLRTGCCPALAEHPLRRFFDRGLMVVLNSDDPAMFQTSLAQEYQLAQDAFGFTDAELRTLAMNSFRASFLPEEKKQRYLAMS